MQLTEKEEAFIADWEINRTRKRSLIWKLAVGLPTGALIVLGIYASLIGGWFSRADITMRVYSNSIVLALAALGIVTFVTVFSAKHKWDINEQHYLELLAKRDRP